MNDAHVGSLVVLDGTGGLLGIFTERDVMRRVVAASKDPAQTVVGDVMTRSVHTCPPETPLDDLRTLNHRVVAKLRQRASINNTNAAIAFSLGDLVWFLAGARKW